MEEKDKIIINLKQENQMLKRDNQIMRNELMRYSGVNLNMLLNNNNNNQMSHQNFNINNNINNSQMQMFPNTQENIFNKNWSNSNQNPVFLPPIQQAQYTPNGNNRMRQNFYQMDVGKKSSPYSLQENLSSQPNQWFINNNNGNNSNSYNGNLVNNNNNNNNFNPNKPSNNFYRNEGSGSIRIETPKNELSLLQENLKLKEKISNLENAFMGGNTTLLPDKSKFSREDFFSEKDDKEDKDNSIVKLLLINS
jgi:hypothetical protein